MAYQHTQTGRPMRIAFGLMAVGFLAMAALGPFDGLRSPRVVFGVGAVLAALSTLWSRMTIRIDDQLRWWFGPGWPRFSVPLADITRVAPTRTTFLEGWGIHRTRRGWLYNVAGRDAVHIVRADGREFMLGTDEPRRLVAALERALPAAGRARSRR